VQIGSIETTSINTCGGQINFSHLCFIQDTIIQENASKISSSKISSNQTNIIEMGSSQINIPQNRPFKVDSSIVNGFLGEHVTRPITIGQFSPSKVPFSIGIPHQQFLSSNLPNHNLTSNFIFNIKSNTTNLWQNLLPPTNIDITYQITDLPTGQLAEATITGFDAEGNPNQGTILIDRNANGIGWFIDETPFENSEFRIRNAEWAFQATSESEAYGKYDLLTAILHETAHLYGFIDGYAPFEKHISWNNGTPVFIGDNFTATLTPDLDHLQTAHHPYDLLNTHLAPGIRKLPSELDIQILQAIVSEAGSREKGAGRNILQAPLTSTPLIAILNGDFTIGDRHNPQFGWLTRGDSTIVAEQAILREDSPFLSNFSQTFTIPEGAKILQFTIANT
jgi:hypothetical protein